MFIDFQSSSFYSLHNIYISQVRHSFHIFFCALKNCFFLFDTFFKVLLYHRAVQQTWLRQEIRLVKLHFECHLGIYTPRFVKCVMSSLIVKSSKFKVNLLKARALSSTRMRLCVGLKTGQQRCIEVEITLRSPRDTNDVACLNSSGLIVSIRARNLELVNEWRENTSAAED